MTPTLEPITFRLGAEHAVAQLKAFVVCELSHDEAALTRCTRAEESAAFWHGVIAKAPQYDADKECVAAILLNRKHKAIGWNLVSIGTSANALVHPREVLRACLAANATAFVLLHNHPSVMSDTVEFIRVTPPPHCSKQAVILVEKGLEVTPVEVDHYAKLIGRTVTEIRFESFEGQPLPVIVFKDGLTAAVFCDPEGNGAGHLDIEQP